MAHIVSFGELLVDMVGPSGASLSQAPHFLKAPGGAPANVAVGVARLGGESAFVGQVGNDPFGIWLREVLEAEKVSCKYLQMSEAARTTLAFVATRLDGRKEICFFRNPGADAEFAPENFDAACLDGAAIFHCGSVSLSLEPCRQTQMLALQSARERGVLISYDPNWRPSLWHDLEAAREQVRAILPLSDLVKIADEELEFICGTDDFAEAASQVLELGPKAVIITRGADGVYFQTEHDAAFIPGFRVDAIDTLGAGDSFVAAMLTQIVQNGLTREDLRRANWREMLRFCNASGAIATQTAGGIPSLPTRPQVEAFLANQTLKIQADESL